MYSFFYYSLIVIMGIFLARAFLKVNMFLIFYPILKISFRIKLLPAMTEILRSFPDKHLLKEFY